MKRLFTFLLSMALMTMISAAPPTITSFSPASGAVGTLVTITGTNLGSPTAFTIGGVTAIVVSNTGTQLVGLVMPGAVTGVVSVTTASGTGTSGSNFTVTATSYPGVQQGSKLVGNDNSGAAEQGWVVSVSADGNTAIVGGFTDNANQGAAWIYTRSGGIWTQQGNKLVGTGNIGAAYQGQSVSISADGNTAIVGGDHDNTKNGAAWIYTRSGVSWTQQGSKLVGTDTISAALQGYSVSLSADGNTAIVGGDGDNSNVGAAWVFTRSGGIWTKHSKLVGTGVIGPAQQGISVSLSADGNTAIVGGYHDNSNQGAAWIYTYSGVSWSQQAELVGTGSIGLPVYQGTSVALSADGNTAMVGGFGDNTAQGAAWVYIRSGSTWAQQNKLVGTSNTGAARQGYSVSLSADGNTALVGGHFDNSSMGAAWVFTRTGGTWTQQGSKLVGTGSAGAPVYQGKSVSLSADGNTAMVGGFGDNTNQGAAWAFYVAPPVISSFTPASGAVGATVTITGTNFNITPANNVVFFGATRATVSAASATSLTVTVPAGATYAPITVLNTETTLAAYSMMNFSPTYSPNKGSISTGDFAAKVDFTTGANPQSVAIGDIDGDGKPDLVIANYSDNTVSVLRNTGSSGSTSFAAKVDFTTGSHPYSVAIGDIDGDGKPDLVIANYDNNVSVLRNTSSSGSISFATKVDFTTVTTPYCVAIGDLDGDGKPDLAVANYGSSTASVFLNTGSSGTISFAAKVDFTTGTHPSSVAIGDIDGDGKPDLAVANAYSSNVSVLRNTSSGVGNINFATKVDFTTGSYPYSIAIGDLDGDGKPDLAVANYTSNTVSVLRNTSSGVGNINFAATVDLTTGSYPYSVAIGDLDGDGKPDLAVANASSAIVFVLRNTSSGVGNINFAATVDLTTGSNPYSVAIGDIDGDGKPDLVVANSGTASVSVLRNTQANTWTGAANTTNWATTGNWSAIAIPTASDNVIIPLKTYEPTVNEAPGSPAVGTNLTINSDAILTIAAGKALTVSGALSNNNLTSGIVIQSDATGTGSLITGTATGTGTATAQRWMTAGSWHYVSSPLVGQTVTVFLAANDNIASNGRSRGMMDYFPTDNTWNDFFTNSTGGSFVTGKGFSMRVGNNAAAVIFTGSLQAGTLSATGLTDAKWNCIGNPYTSAIRITHNTSLTDNFLDVNADNFDPSYGAIYVWVNGDGNNGLWGHYTVVSNISPPFNDIQQGQAFMVNMKTGVTSASFTSAMQNHTPDLALKSSKVPWPTIKLIATVSEQNNSTLIAFNSAMTKGLDPTYDAGLLKGGSDLIVYTRLVKDNGIPFAIQALPDNDFSNMIIPIGLDFKTGGEVTFSSENMNLPMDCKVILEDKLTKTFTDLSTNVYKTVIAANASIIDRFFLHTSNSSGVMDNPLPDKLTAYANRNIEIRVIGEVSKNAVATLYDIHGRIVLVKQLQEANLNIIPTPNIKTGVYMLSVKDNGKLNGFKILVSE